MFGLKIKYNDDYEVRQNINRERYLDGRKDYKKELLNALKSDCLNRDSTLTIQDIIEWIEGIN